MSSFSLYLPSSPSSLPSLPEGNLQAVGCWTPCCLFLMSFGIWQICAVQMHAAEPACMLSPLLWSGLTTYLYYHLKKRYSFILSGSAWEYWSFSLFSQPLLQVMITTSWQTSFCPKCWVIELMILTFQGSKIETTASKHWRYMSSGFNSFPYEFIPLENLNRENSS